MNLKSECQRRPRAFLMLALALWLGAALALGGPSHAVHGQPLQAGDSEPLAHAAASQPVLSQPLQTIAVSVSDVYTGGLVGVTLRGGQQEYVRLAGISISSCVEGDAAARILALTGGRWGYLELASQQRDSNGYLAGYISIDSIVLNVDLVRIGVAVPAAGPTRYQQELASARNAARGALAGGWGTGCFS